MTRIIAGRFKGRRLTVPKGRDVRPTTDRMRERLFSMLAHGRYPPLDGARVADFFAGTGALGLEAMSRGAVHAVFIEQARPSLTSLRDNIRTLGVENETDVLAVSATKLPAAKNTVDFIFMDPPYRQGLVAPALASIQANGWLADDSIIVCELASDEPFDIPHTLHVMDERQQGQQRLLILSPTPAP